jgi:hypothetical protein
MELKNTEIKDALGNPAIVPDSDNNPTQLMLFDAVRTIVWTLPAADLTLGDSEIAREVLRGLHAASQNGNLWKANDAHYEWMKKIVTEHATRVFGINAICVVEEI